MTFSLSKLLGERSPPASSATGQCELCALPIEDVHGHVVDTVDRRLLCTCYACSLLFETGEGAGRLKAVPKRYARIGSPLFSDAQWDALGIPIGLAFFFETGAQGDVVAFYPSAAGAMQSQLPLESWQALREREPLLATMRRDVEAALVYRPRTGTARAFVVPIDACYELVGLVRTKWSGVSGGDAVHEAIEEFFDRIAERAA